METKKTPKEIKAEQNYPGAAIDAADSDKVTAQEVKERTCTLDSNPATDSFGTGPATDRGCGCE